ALAHAVQDEGCGGGGGGHSDLQAALDAGVGDHAAAGQDDAGVLGAREDVAEVDVGHEYQVGDVAGRDTGLREAEHRASTRGDRVQGLLGGEVARRLQERGRLERVGPAR